MNKIKCACGKGCDYKPSTYEQVNKLKCNNSRMDNYNASFEDSLLGKIEAKDEKGADEWVKKAEQGEIMRIM